MGSVHINCGVESVVPIVTGGENNAFTKPNVYALAIRRHHFAVSVETPFIVVTRTEPGNALIGVPNPFIVVTRTEPSYLSILVSDRSGTKCEGDREYCD